MMAGRNLIIALIATIILSTTFVVRAREIQPLDFDWRFALGEQKHAEDPAFDDSKWRMVDLPHDWSIEGEYQQSNPAGGTGAYLPGGIGWYRRVIDMPESRSGKRVSIEFDAAQRNSDVWINGHHLGSRVYGYISFSYDITPYLKPGKNVLAVRLDNSQLPAARWYTGSGIYGHVKLVVTDPLHIARNGIFVAPIKVSTDSATLDVRMTVINQSTKHANFRVTSDILDDTGAKVFSGEVNGDIDAGGEWSNEHQAIIISRPHLWSPNAPAVYTLVTRVYDDGQFADEVKAPFGIRTFRWDADTGFWLNNQNVKLKGVGMHYDAGPLGVAIPDSILEQRLRLLKSLGCNAIRTGHTPFPPKFYELCDRLGLLVLDEAFDGWRKKAAFDYGATAFKDGWQRDLTDVVLRDRNHPCVFMWSIGNETGEDDRFGMSKLIHELDPTRATTGGEVLHGVDVSGFNGPGESPGVLEKFHRENPNQPIVLTEEPHGYQTRGFYKTLTWWRDNNPEKRVPFPPYASEEIFKFGGDPQYNSSYDNATVRITARQSWKIVRDTPWIAGEFRWAAFDYLGEAGVMGRKWPARFWHPGIIDAAGFPKDIAYFYQSQWTSEPMVHVLPHWTHPLVAPGTKIPVVAYSNCDEVELLLNNKSLGRIPPRKDLLDFVWDVPNEPGEIKAIGFRGGKVAAQETVRTARSATHVYLETDGGKLSTERGDARSVTFSIRDANETLVPDANDRVEFQLRGPAQLLGYENGNNIDVTPHRVDHRDAFDGLGRGFFRSTGEAGPVELTAAAILGEQRFQNSTTVAMDVQRIALRGDLPPATFEIRYTTNGSEPTASSQKFTSQFTLSSPAMIRMIVLRDGRPFMKSEAKFDQGDPIVITDPHYEHSATTSPATDFATKPHDAHVASDWSDANRTLRFKSDGTVVRIEGKSEQPVAAWWYEFPSDTFEDAADVGSGEMRWNNSEQTSQLKLDSRGAKELIITTDGKQRRLKRQG
jgi:beta-galactosidase